MFKSQMGTSRTIVFNEDKRCLDLMYNIVTNNLQTIKDLHLVDNTNSNKIIDSTNNMTAIHYAAQLSDSSIELYLLALGANPSIKNKYGSDAFDISIKFNKRLLFDNKIQKLQTENKDLIDETINLRKRNKEQSVITDYANESCQNYKLKNQKINAENNFLTTELGSQKVKNTLLMKEIINKDAKIAKLDATIENFLIKNKK